MNRLSSSFFQGCIIWAAACVATGWCLSLFHALIMIGYAVALPLVAVGLAWLIRDEKQGTSSIRRPWLPILSRRFRRPLPLIFVVAAALELIGGIIYAPNNFDALTYRLPRMLNWVDAGSWFWIPTFNPRMNFSGAVWEWMSMPLLIFTRSDRGMFLINALGFLLMPGLLFSIFRQLGVAHKVAWTWMWLLPLAYGFVTQAGSVGNDLLGALFCLLSVHFGLRARRSGRVSDVWLALLAAALLTGVKLSNLPLALPCLVAVWPALGPLRKNLIGSLAVAGIAVVISAVPIMALNYLNTGGWNGDPQNKYKMQVENPVAGFLGNSFLLAEQSLMPPVLPGSRRLDQRLTEALPDSLRQQFIRLHWNKLNELPGEEGAGLGLGVTLPLLLVLGATVVGCGWAGSNKNVFSLLPSVALAVWVAILFFMAKMGSEAGPRLMLPYYLPAIIPFLLLPAQNFLLRWRLWRGFLVLLALGVLPALVLSVSRPLWPAQSISKKLAQAQLGNETFQRLATTYVTYAHRNDFLAPIRAALPDNVAEIGFIAGSNDSDYSLWRPIGRRKVKYLRNDPRHFFQNPDAVEWVVVKENIWPEICPVPLEEWAPTHHAKIVLSLPITELVSWGPEKWFLLHFDKADRSPVSVSR